MSLQGDSLAIADGPALTLSVKDGCLTAMATHGKRLALVERILEDASASQDGDIIIIQKCANETT